MEGIGEGCTGKGTPEPAARKLRMTSTCTECDRIDSVKHRFRSAGMMNIGSICRREAVAINASANLRAAASLMREEHVGFVVVVDGAGGSDGARVVGVLTDRDIVTAAVARDADPRT